MKKIKVAMKKMITWGLLIFTVCGCSLNNPFLATEELVVEPPKEEELPPPPPEPIHVESISVVSGTEIERLPGREYVLDYIIYPENADDKSVTITIDDEKVAILDKKTGKIFAGGEDCIGKSTVITVTTNDGKKVAKINFKVIPIPDNSVFVEEIVIDGVDVIYDDGNKWGFSAKLLPEDVSEEFKDVVWSITEKDVVQREQQGSIGLSIWRDNEITEETEITIRATSPHKKSPEDPDIFAEKKVKVKHKPRPEIIVTSPNGGEEYTFKTNTTITWTTKDIESDKVKIELIDTLTDTKYVIVEDAENSGSYYWYLAADAEYGIGENYKIQITTIPNADESADVVVSDEGDDAFKLSKIVPTIDLTSPTKETNNGYFYLSNTINANIEWLSTDMESDNVSLYLIKKDGSPVEVIAENIPNSSSYIWNLPEDKNDWADGSEYKIKIYRYDVEKGKIDEEVSSESSMEFRLEEVDNPFLKFLAPSGKKLYIGTQNDITWEGVGFSGDVKIELVPEDTSVRNYVIAESTPNDSRYEWFISEDIMKGGGFDLSTKYKIRITTLNTDIRYLSGNRQGQLIDKMEDTDGNPIKDIDGNEIVLENPGTLVAESAIYLEAILAPNVYFLLDDSGSMNSGSPTRMEILKKRMDNASVALAKNFNIGMASFHKKKDGQNGLLKLAKGHSAETIRAAYADISAPWRTPTGQSLREIREMKKYELEDDIYNEYRRKAVVVITDGDPLNNTGTAEEAFQEAKQESALLAANGVPVFYMGISAGSLTSSLSKKLQDMAIAGGSDNPTDPDRNWYPIDQDSQFEAALNEIMYGDLEVAGSMVEYEITCDTPDNGNSIYFFGDHLLLGGTTSPASASGLLKATYKDGKYSIKIRKQDNANFSWGIVEADSKGNILKIEKSPLHTSDETSTRFNGWDENTIIIKVAKSYNYNYIYAWDIKAETPILSAWPGVAMTLSGNDYVYTIIGRTSCGLLITKQNGDKLCETDMKISAPGIYRVDKNGIKKEN